MYCMNGCVIVVLSDNNGCMYGCVIVFRNMDTFQPGDCAAHDWLVTNNNVYSVNIVTCWELPQLLQTWPQ